MKLHNILTYLVLLVSVSMVRAQSLTLEELWLQSKYRTEYNEGFDWASDGVHYYRMAAAEGTDFPSIQKVSVKIGTTNTLTSNAKTILLSDTFSFSGYRVSPDERYILFSYNEEPIYRRSSKAYYFLYTCATGQLKPAHTLTLGKLTAPEFSPDSKYIAYVRDNNLYFTETTTIKEKAVTKDGAMHRILNGVCDWVYEEEFEFAQAYAWSPDGSRIAYYRFDERAVKEYNLQYWGDLYPTDYRYKYPKAGEANSSVSLHCYHLASGSTTTIDSSIPGEREYFPRMRWTGLPHMLSYHRLNRLQNNLQIVHHDANTLQSRVVFAEQNNSYVEINDHHRYLKGSESFVFTSERSGYRHLYFCEPAQNKLTPLTEGNYEIEELLSVDEKKFRVYFSSHAHSSTEKHLCSTDLSKQLSTHTTEPGWHDISFSPKGAYYVDMYSNAQSPYVYTLYETSSHKPIRTLVDNSALREKLNKLPCSPIELMPLTTASGQTLNAWMLKPLKMESGKKYPVLLSIYGGPGSQKAVDQWGGMNYIWYQLLAQKGYIVVCVDGRGTGGRGVGFKKCTQFALGNYETEDLIETAKYLRSLPYIDGERIGIFGWSYGGYLSSLAITKGADYFRTAIAVAPVTNWRYYDNIYTERYMGLPSENKGYDNESPIRYASRLKGSYLLIHGTADDNVHIQNALEMQRALIAANKQFDCFYYPDKNHGIYGGNTRYHLYKMITDFILKKL